LSKHAIKNIFDVFQANFSCSYFTCSAGKCSICSRRIKIDTGDTAWVLISTALVMLMIPAVGLFYGGMVRKKNALSTIMFSFAILALISVQWILFATALLLARISGA